MGPCNYIKQLPDDSFIESSELVASATNGVSAMHQGGLHIRNFSPSDGDGADALLTLSGLGLSSLEFGRLDPMDTFVAVRTKDNTVVGICSFMYNGPLGFCSLFAVDDAYKYTGLSLSLYFAVENRAIQVGVTHMVGISVESSQLTSKMLKARGAMETKPHRHFWMHVPCMLPDKLRSK